MSDAHPPDTHIPTPPCWSSLSLIPLTHTHTQTHTQHQQHSESQHSSWIQLFPWQPRFLHVWNETESAKGPLLLIQRLAIDWSSLQPHTYPPAEHVRASAHLPSANTQHQNRMWCRKAPGQECDREHARFRYADNKGGGAPTFQSTMCKCFSYFRRDFFFFFIFKCDAKLLGNQLVGSCKKRLL